MVKSQGHEVDSAVQNSLAMVLVYGLLFFNLFLPMEVRCPLPDPL